MEKKTLSLHHIIKKPKENKEKSPVLFMLHGYGSNEEDLFSFAPELPETLCIISIRAPHELVPYGHAWYSINFDAEYGKWSNHEEAKQSRELIIKFIDEACKAYNLDSKNISLLGFSQGTILSYAIALSYPEKIKNVVALSGYINENIITENYKDKNHSGLCVYASHGNLDVVIPVDWARKAPEMLNRLQVNHIFEEFPAGHGVAPQNFYSFRDWLSKRI